MSLFEENAAILKEMEKNGTDLGSPRWVDFSHIFPDEASANAFAMQADHEGFEISVDEVERDENPWDVTVSRIMSPTCENITDTEQQLGDLARPYRGQSDGWGFFTS